METQRVVSVPGGVWDVPDGSHPEGKHEVNVGFAVQEKQWGARSLWQKFGEGEATCAPTVELKLQCKWAYEDA